MTEFEQMLLEQCAPTIFGVKQANLFSCDKKNAAELRKELERYTKSGSSTGVQFQILYACKNRIYMIAYRKNAMAQYFAQEEAIAFLRERGYPDTREIDRLLEHLKSRTKTWQEFPHEIGLFLGYPLEDVKAFIAQKGLHFKFCGYWKVYSDEERARKLFYQYERCKEVLRYQVTKGSSLMALVSRELAC